jgi:hypothetical protein
MWRKPHHKTLPIPIRDIKGWWLAGQKDPEV